MAEVEITDLTALTSVDRASDLLEVADASDSNNSKKSTVNSLLDLTSHPVGINDTQTLTNKTLGITNTVTLTDNLFTLQDNSDNTKQAQFQLSSISTATTRTYTLPDVSDTLVTLTATQTLTNKTLTSPTISAATITNPTITVDTLSEFTAANGITIDGLNIKDSKLNTNNSVVTNNITDSAITTAKINADAVTAAKIADDAVFPANLASGLSGSSWATVAFTPTKVGWSSTTVNVWQYQQIGKMVWVYFTVSGTSNSTSTNFQLPITARNVTGVLIEGSYGLASDSGGIGAGPRWSIDPSVSTTTCHFYTTYTGGGWTASGTKAIRGSILYEAA